MKTEADGHHSMMHGKREDGSERWSFESRLCLPRPGVKGTSLYRKMLSGHANCLSNPGVIPEDPEWRLDPHSQAGFRPEVWRENA